MESSDGGGGGEDQLKQMAELSKTLKEGERILAPTRRPDGTLRKPLRIRAGYVPQDEVAIYQSKGALWKKEMASHDEPPGYDPPSVVKSKTKSAKRNERKKEKRLQAADEKDKVMEQVVIGEIIEAKESYVDNGLEPVQSLSSQMNELSVSTNPKIENPSEPIDNLQFPSNDIDKRIRAIKKKIRIAEAQLQKTPLQDMKPEQMNKLSKLENWRSELMLLEEQRLKLNSLS